MNTPNTNVTQQQPIDTNAPQLSAAELRYLRRQKYTETHFATLARDARAIQACEQARDEALQASMHEREEAARAAKAQLDAARDKMVKQYVRQRKAGTSVNNYRDISADTHITAYKDLKPKAPPAFVEQNKAHFAALRGGQRLSTAPDEFTRTRLEQDLAYQAMLEEERRVEQEQQRAAKRAMCEQLLHKLRPYQKYQPEVAAFIRFLEQVRDDESPTIRNSSEVVTAVAWLSTMPRFAEECSAFLSFVTH